MRSTFLARAVSQGSVGGEKPVSPSSSSHGGAGSASGLHGGGHRDPHHRLQQLPRLAGLQGQQGPLSRSGSASGQSLGQGVAPLEGSRRPGGATSDAFGRSVSNLAGPPASRNVNFVRLSPRTPTDIFSRDGLFNASTSSLTSRPLSSTELNKLSKTLGFMPRVAQMHMGPCNLAKVEEHIAKLDDELRDRVQNICDRFNEASSGMGGRCASSWRWLHAMRGHLRLGILREIWMEILFFFLYSMGLQWYAYIYDWDFQWSAFNQDTVYYPALVMSFLLSFRASDCMVRFQTGCECIFKMEKHLRQMAFDVMTKLSLGEPWGEEGGASDLENSLKKRYFKHEFRRLSQVLFVCAARDLNDSAADEEEDSSAEEPSMLRCSLTDVEHAAVHVTHSSYGHIFRVYMAAAWLSKLVRQANEASLFDDSLVVARAEENLSEFKGAWMKARSIAYSCMPDSITHLLWVLACATNFVLPWEYVSVCQWMTWLPSVFASVSFFGIVRIAANMENPFGFDEDDIPVWDVAEHLDEEVSLIMFYAALDEVGGENLYRGLASQDHIYVAA